MTNGIHTPIWNKNNHLTPSARVESGQYVIGGINTYLTKEEAKKRAIQYTKKTDFRSRVFKMKNGKWGVYATD